MEPTPSAEPMILIGGALYLLGGIFLLLVLYAIWAATRRVRTWIRMVLVAGAGIVGFGGLGLLMAAGEQARRATGELTRDIAERLAIPIVTIGESQITIWRILQIVLYVVVVVVIAGLFRRFLLKRVFAHGSMDITLQRAIAGAAGWVVISLGLMMGLQAAGFDISILAVAAGTLGIGAGFGLQDLAANMAAGLTILIERPFRVGDRIEIGDIHGRVTAIRIRSTTLVTNDYIAVIVPNAGLVNSNVVNWSYGQRQRLFAIPVGVRYGTDVRLVERTLLEVARNYDAVLQDPKPWVRFREFGDSSYNMELMVCTASMLDSPRRFISDLNFGIVEAFRREGIQIPFPQRDLHIRSGLEEFRPSASS